jgi:apolipoprotein N-acyltransferase
VPLIDRTVAWEYASILSTPSSLSLQKKIILAAASGGLGYLTFPKPGLSALAWVGLIPLVVAVYRETSPVRAFSLGLVAGIAFFTGTCHWIAHVLQNYGGLSWIGSALLFALLAVHLSLFYGLFAWAFARLSCWSSSQCFWLAPGIWVSTEYLRAHVLTGFPWCLLGYALVDSTSLAQLASVTGVYGLSFVAMAVNARLAALIVSPGKVAFHRLGLVVFAIAGLTLAFAAVQREPPHTRQPVRIVQTNIGLEQEWDLESKLSILDDLARLSRQTSEPSWTWESQGLTPLILWPETPAPFYFNHDADFRRRMQDIATSANAHFLFGFVDFRASSNGSKQPDPYNSVGLLSPRAELISQYDKIHLVPFGEYVPYTSVFFFVDKVSTEAGNFKPGKRVVVSPLGDNRKLGAFVCYEAVVPDLIRRFAKGGAQVLVNVTNDAWFGESAAPFQHLAMARMRAIENHRYLLRAANNGISAIIDPSGRVLETVERNRRTVLESSFDFETRLTCYAQVGDVFAWLCLAISGVSVVLCGSRTVNQTRAGGL